MEKEKYIIIDGIKYQLVKRQKNNSVCIGCSLNLQDCISNTDIKCSGNTIYKKLSDIRKTKIKKIFNKNEKKK